MEKSKVSQQIVIGQEENSRNTIHKIKKLEN